jgi:hypothetical protein
MPFVFVLLGSFVGLDLFVWIRLHFILGRVRHARWWRAALSVAMLAAIGLAFVSLARKATFQRSHSVIPPAFPASVYIWHFLVLPPTAVVLLFAPVIGWVGRKVKGRREREAMETAAPVAAGHLWSRRNFLKASALLTPPLATGALTGIAMSQIGEFRVRGFDLSLAGWPKELDGMSIAVVADVHTGVFSTQKMLNDIADRTNNMRADLIVLAGDLINLSHADLPSALDMVAKLDAPGGVYMIEGNHDVMQGRERFNRAVRERRFNLLVDELVTVRPRGTPIQLLGARWPFGDIDQSVIDAAEGRDPSLFPILLAHHPHSWDQARREKIPLVISGHTHGGQIMLTDKIGAGPIRFKYWSGLYETADSKLIVSNGVGNWFPLRVNAPAELLQLKLHSAAS